MFLQKQKAISHILKPIEVIDTSWIGAIAIVFIQKLKVKIF